MSPDIVHCMGHYGLHTGAVCFPYMPPWVVLIQHLLPGDLLHIFCQVICFTRPFKPGKAHPLTGSTDCVLQALQSKGN